MNHKERKDHKDVFRGFSGPFLFVFLVFSVVKIRCSSAFWGGEGLATKNTRSTRNEIAMKYRVHDKILQAQDS